MTDIEITKLCAQAMGYTLDAYAKGFRVRDQDNDVIYIIGEGWGRSQYNPLHDDAQAMALVKKFEIRISRTLRPAEGWFAEINNNQFGSSTDLNRAICECVAKMEAAK